MKYGKSINLPYIIASNNTFEFSKGVVESYCGPIWIVRTVPLEPFSQSASAFQTT